MNFMGKRCLLSEILRSFHKLENSGEESGSGTDSPIASRRAIIKDDDFVYVENGAGSGDLACKQGAQLQILSVFDAGSAHRHRHSEAPAWDGWPEKMRRIGY